MSDELLEKYGQVFVRNNYLEIYNLRFDEYVELLLHNMWDKFVEIHKLLESVTFL